jgi:hypothetical protein
VNGDGRADIISGTEVGGGPRVSVFDGITGAVIQNFFAFDEQQRGGVRVAAADYNGDGFDDIVCTTGVGVQTRIKVIDGRTGATLTDFVPYTEQFTGGVYVTAGDFDGNGTPDIIASADAGGGPHVQVFSGLGGSVIASYFAYEPSFTGGVRVSATDVDGDGRSDIVTAPGLGSIATVRIWQGGSLTELDSFAAFDSTYTGGVYVG